MIDGPSQLARALYVAASEPPGRRLTLDMRIGLQQAAQALWDQASRRGVDPAALVETIKVAAWRGRHGAFLEGLPGTRLDPHKRDEYSRRADQARDLAQWLAAELVSREPPVLRLDGAMHIRSKGMGATHDPPECFGDLVAAKILSRGVVVGQDGRVTLGCRGPTELQKLGADRQWHAESLVNASTALAQAADVANGLLKLADLLAEDAKRARPVGAAAKPWKDTAVDLKAVFRAQLKKPMLAAVGVLVAIIHALPEPPPAAEVSRCRKPPNRG